MNSSLVIFLMQRHVILIWNIS